MDLDALGYQYEKMTTAMVTLLSFELAPHQRITGAMSEFVLAFGPDRVPPEGEAFRYFETISRIMGTANFPERAKTLSPEHRDELAAAFLGLDRCVVHAYYSKHRRRS